MPKRLASTGVKRIRRIVIARSYARDDPEALAVVLAIGAAMTGYLTTSLFLHDAYQRQLWIIAALAYASARITRRHD